MIEFSSVNNQLKVTQKNHYFLNSKQVKIQLSYLEKKYGISIRVGLHLKQKSRIKLNKKRTVKRTDETELMKMEDRC